MCQQEKKHEEVPFSHHCVRCVQGLCETQKEGQSLRTMQVLSLPFHAGAGKLERFSKLLKSWLMPMLECAVSSSAPPHECVPNSILSPEFSEGNRFLDSPLENNDIYRNFLAKVNPSEMPTRYYRNFPTSHERVTLQPSLALLNERVMRQSLCLQWGHPQ